MLRSSIRAARHSLAVFPSFSRRFAKFRVRASTRRYRPLAEGERGFLFRDTFSPRCRESTKQRRALHGPGISDYRRVSHRHLRVYLAGRLTWRKLENTGYRPNLSAILRASHCRLVAAAIARFTRVALATAASIGWSTRDANPSICRCQCPMKTNVIAEFFAPARGNT